MQELTRRERQVLRLIVDGRSTKQIAFDLGMSLKTAACHRYHIMQKTGASNAADLVRLTVTNSPPNPNVPLNELGIKAAKSCAESRANVRLLSAQLAKSRELRKMGQETLKEMRLLQGRIFEKSVELARGMGRTSAEYNEQSIRSVYDRDACLNAPARPMDHRQASKREVGVDVHRWQLVT
jgi:DNA-binding CsgD family transcriptional regulator